MEKKDNKLSNSTKQLKVILYYSYIYKIGGIESWLYNMSQHLCDYYDLTVMFDNGNMEQLKRINKYVNVEHRDITKTYNCDVLLVASHLNKYPENVKCSKCISVVHSDYKYYRGLIDTDSIGSNADKIVSVSERASQSLRDITGLDSTVIPNILSQKVNTNKVLHLISFTRLSPEKGYDRMCYFVRKLKENNVKFDWKIFSDLKEKQMNRLNYPEIIFMQPTLDVYDYIADADYLVQLSDTEAFCYSAHEALQYDTPVIVTDIEVFNNIITDGYNGYKFNLDMSNVNEEMIDKIVNHIPKDFEYDTKFDELKNDWFQVVGEPLEVKNKPLSSSTVKVEVLEEYTDLELGRLVKLGDVIEVSELRAYELTSINNNAHRRLCKII